MAARRDLLDLELQQVDLACAGARIAAERGELGVEPLDLGAGAAQRVERVERRTAREPVERGALHRGCEQRLVGVLTVEVDERGPDLRELRDRREPAVRRTPRERPSSGMTRASTIS